ncbi:hypothetical protein L208DRAFT_1205075, partial [Tricholoma matsutake]
QEKQQAIDDAVSKWYLYTITKANDLAHRFNKKPWYFLNVFFEGSAHMVNHHSKVNAHNMFKSIKAQELHKDGHPLRLIKLQDKYKEEYENLTREEHEELVKEFTAQ